MGAEGEVVGLDASAEALALAREGLRRRGYSRIELVRADLDTATLATFGESQPFDLAYIRRFLVHQADPAASLIRIARLLRPGGRIVAHEIPPATGYPRLTPMVPTLRRVDDLVHAAVKARGGTHDVANRFGALCDTAGLRLIEQRGVVPAVEPIELLETFQAVLRALGPGAIAQGVTTPDEVESMLRGLEAAKSGQYVSAFGNLYIEMVAEAP